MSDIKLFIENKVIGGYSLAVRDDWSFKIKRVNVTKEEKDEYKTAYGNEIITYEEFFQWWSKINEILVS